MNRYKITFLVSLFLFSLVAPGAARSNELTDVTLFFDDFEGDLSKWTGKGGGSFSGEIIDDPKEDDSALNFSDLMIAGDLFSKSAFSSTSDQYRFSFDYLGLEQQSSQAGDLGGYAGYSAALPGSHVWLAGTGRYRTPISLQDDGSWHSYAVEFTSDNPVHIMLEDWSGSGGIAGDAYFDNVRLEAVGVKVASTPESTSLLGLFSLGSIGLLLRRQSQKKNDRVKACPMTSAY